MIVQINNKVHGVKGLIIDDEDFAYVSRYKWYYNTNKWGHEYVYRLDKKGKKRISIHRELINPPKNLEVDHINGNTLDNRKSNLRACTTQQNQWNRGKQINNTSGFKGVTWHKARRKWRAHMVLNKKNIYIGEFKDILKAARAYEERTKELYGEYFFRDRASLNTKV